jgi:hypothetical protein
MIELAAETRNQTINSLKSIGHSPEYWSKMYFTLLRRSLRYPEGAQNVGLAEQHTKSADLILSHALISTNFKEHLIYQEYSRVMRGDRWASVKVLKKSLDVDLGINIGQGRYELFEEENSRNREREYLERGRKFFAYQAEEGQPIGTDLANWENLLGLQASVKPSLFILPNANYPIPVIGKIYIKDGQAHYVYSVPHKNPACQPPSNSCEGIVSTDLTRDSRGELKTAKCSGGKHKVSVSATSVMVETRLL